jgi:predicted Zn-dependent protease
VELDRKALQPRVALAAALASTGKRDEARAIALALQKELPKSPDGLALEADIAMTEQKFPEAVAALRKALAIQNTALLQVKLHQAVRASGNAAEADAMIRKMVAERPDDVGIRNYAGDYAVSRSQWAQAIEHYKVLLARQPSNALALNNMAWAMHEAKDPAALQTAEKALAAAPESPAVMDTAGVILVAAGKTERGIELLRKAVAAAPQAPALRLHLAEALIGNGDKAGARAEIDTVLKDAPQGALAERARALQGSL